MPDFRAVQNRTPDAESVSLLRRGAVATALTLMLTTLWLVLHRYPGIDNDAQLYAFQALARLHPAFLNDLYLQNTSQDAFTIFSPIYAAATQIFGLQMGTLILTVVCIVGFLAAAWVMVARIYTADAAWLAVGALILLPGAYGGGGVFHLSDRFLSARLPAVALIVAALALHYSGRKTLSLASIAIAFAFHPIMALPGLVLLIFVWSPTRLAIGGGIAGIAVTALVGVTSLVVPHLNGALTLMDDAWLEVLKQRSHFLFLNLWNLGDWKENAIPFVGLGLTWTIIPQPQIRKLCANAALVGACGLAVAWIASVIPVAIMVQGQAWRWVWLTDFVCIALLAPTALTVWRDPKVGPMCAMVLMLGWTDPSVDNLTCAGAVLILWLARPHVTDRAAVLLRWGALALATVILAWSLAVSWDMIAGASSESGREPLLVTRIRNIVGLDVVALALTVAVWIWLRTNRSMLSLLAAFGAFFGTTLYLAPRSFDQTGKIGSPALSEEFADWRAAIPDSSTVFLADKKDTGSFVWFVLGRPSYLSINQSAGVVFSRATALEIKRRSEVVLPIVDPDWHLLQGVIAAHAHAKSDTSHFRPLTEHSLREVCSDRELGFVVAKEFVGFDPIEHTHAGDWKGWYLYDCQIVRRAEPNA